MLPTIVGVRYNFRQYILGKDSCTGDSGAPLMMTKREGSELIWTQIGIVSFGRTLCGEKGVPGVYTKVSAYTPWILEHIGDYKQYCT